MAALPGILGLLVFIYMRPHEFVRAIESVPFLYVFLALAVAGIALDVARGKTRITKAPQLAWASAFVGWALFTLAIRVPSALGQASVQVLVCFVFFLIIAHGVQSLAALRRTTMAVFALGLFVASVGVHQHFAPTRCVVMNPMDRGTKPDVTDIACESERDGAPVDGVGECYELGEPGLAYACENVGLFETSSVGGGRVRYLGVLTDPNELALATAIAVPFAFAFYEQRRRFWRLALLIATLGVVSAEVIYTQSRGGQLVLAAVLGVYFVRRFGWKRGALVGLAMLAPVVALGGRSGEDASQSSMERLEAGAAGLKMLLSSPVWGLGYTQYTEHHPITAHNAYVLAAGELGFVGAYLFCMVLLISIKIPISILRAELPDEPETDEIKPLAAALIAAWVGMFVGIFFLSWTYHYILWIHVGLSGALHSAVRARHPDFRVKAELLDLVIAFVALTGLLGSLTVYTKLKGAW